jgi:hypothetical protein
MSLHPPELFGKFILLVALLFAGRPAAAAPPSVTPRQIDAAIGKAKEFIYQQQRPEGRWETDPMRKGTDHEAWRTMQGDTYGGYTALATYALLAAGESPNDPRIQSAISFLKHCDMVGVYAVAMRLQVWLLIPHDSTEMKALIHKDADFLINGINQSDSPDGNSGLWDYLGKGPRVDHSVSQYGVLGLWAAQQSGAVDVGSARWKTIEAAWRHDQRDDGGWCYDRDGNETAPMTAAGVATLFITADFLHADDAIACIGSIRNPWLERGLAWIDANYDQIGQNNYAMYGIERIGTASGYTYFASHNWFADLSAQLLSAQAKEGSWESTYPGATPLDATCFALLFLARGHAPVMMNKLDYRPRFVATTQPEVAATQMTPVNWNERPRDLANLSAWVGRETETYRNWQIVNLRVSLDEMHDAPILYMSGNEAFTLAPDEAKTLKLFAQQGGMILANADCGREAFAKSFKDLGRSLFGGTFRELPADHPIFTHEQFPGKRWRTRPPVLALSNGVRELMVLLPSTDPARWWQTPNGAEGHEDAYELGIDLYQYSIDRQLWNKGISFTVHPDPQVRASHKVSLARLAVGTNWDPEPGGWPRLAAILHNEDRLDLAVFAATPGQGSLAAARLAHLTGTTAFTLTDSARLEIQNFVKQGGTLIIDAAGGSQAFADAAERELQLIFGTYAAAGLATPLSPAHPLFHLPGHEIRTFSYRPWARLNSVGALKDPRIRMLEVGNRPAVFFSREDLSAGIVGEPVDGVIGYSPETATDILRNILLYGSRIQAHAP